MQTLLCSLCDDAAQAFLKSQMMVVRYIIPGLHVCGWCGDAAQQVLVTACRHKHCRYWCGKSRYLYAQPRQEGREAHENNARMVEMQLGRLGCHYVLHAWQK